MQKKIKILIISLVLILLGIFALISFGLYSMEIEDHYGDIQTAFYNSKNGDIIVNVKTRKIGFIRKDWKTIHVIEKNNRVTDLYNWVYTNGKETKFKIYRLKKELDYNSKLEYSEFIEKVKLGELIEIETELKATFKLE
jgi:hypothetical protein